MTLPRSLRVIHIVPSYFPATYWGGPIFSTKMVCDELAKRPGFSVSVLTTDAAGASVSQRVNAHGIHFGYPVFFARRIAGHSISPSLLWRLYSGIASADIVHLTATFSFPTLPAMLIARFLGKPVIWSPRGAVQATEEWRENPRKFAKRLFLRILRKVAPSRMTIHVTADSERVATMRHFPKASFAVIPNGVELPSTTHKPKRCDPHLSLMFLSRIHPKKGVERLLDAMSNLPIEISLDIYGTGDPRYLAHIQRLTSSFGDRVRLHGEVHGADKLEAYKKADLFVLPSFSENFGIVIAEALAHGVPVLTTTATPWGGLERRGCGLAIDPDSGDLPGAILQLARQDLALMGDAGKRWISEEFSAGAVGDAFAKLYQQKARSIV